MDSLFTVLDELNLAQHVEPLPRLIKSDDGRGKFGTFEASPACWGLQLPGSGKQTPSKKD